jgi:hypothetical protein
MMTESSYPNRGKSGNARSDILENTLSKQEEMDANAYKFFLNSAIKVNYA